MNDGIAIKTGGQVAGFSCVGKIPPANTPLVVESSEDCSETADNYLASQEPYESLVPCFVVGTKLATERGLVSIEELNIGDRIHTLDNGLQQVRWVGSCKFSSTELARSPNLRPVRIRAGALSQKTPTTDLLVSPQHRILLRSRYALRLFGTQELLAPAKQLLQVDGIDIAEDLNEVEYFHILLDAHEIVISNGAGTESLHHGQEALKVMGPAAQEEIFSLFPQLRDQKKPIMAARMLASGRQARKLVVRHLQKNAMLVS